jgi:PEGA domain
VALILAVDPGGARGAALGELARTLSGHEFAVVDAAEAAIATIDERVPNVVLLPAELESAGAAAICAHLRAIAGRDVPAVTLPPLDEVGPAADPRAIAATIQTALRAPVVAAARAVVAWVHSRQQVISGAPALAADASPAGGRGAVLDVDEGPAPPPDVPREPWLGPALAAAGRRAASVVGAAASGAGAAVRAAAPLLRWAPRLAVLAVAIGLVGYAGVKGRPFAGRWIEDLRGRLASFERAPEPAPAPEATPREDAPPAGLAADGGRGALAGSSIPGWVAVFAPFDLVASERGRVIRIDERNEIMLAPGPHEITFRNERLGFEDVRRMDIEPAKTTRLSIIPPRSSISISSNRPADVWLDGEPVGQTPLLDLPADLGTREVRLVTEDGVERRQMVTVTVAPVAVDVDFSRP